MAENQSPVASNPQFPVRLVRACRAFFSIEPEWQDWHANHPFWQASLFEMCDGVFRAFEHLRRRYFNLPTLADDASFFEFADQVSRQEEDEKSTTDAAPTKSLDEMPSESKNKQQGQYRSVALVGEIKNGKSTIAEYLQTNNGFSEYAFAGPLKRGVGILFGFSHEQLWDEVPKETVDARWGVTPRYLLLKIGTEMFRDDLANLIPNMSKHLKHTVWIANMFLHVQRQQQKQQQTSTSSNTGFNAVNHGFNAVNHGTTTSTGVVISDCRFPDEADAVRQLSMVVVRVVRPNIAKTTVASTHTSETLQKLIVPDLTIVNDGTLEQLYEKVESDLLPKIRQE